MKTMTNARKKKTTIPAAEKMIQFKLQLRYIRPPIWRRVLLPDNASLGELHRVIQMAMGWDDCHLHSFFIDNVFYASPSMPGMEGAAMENEDDVSLANVVKRIRQKFTYEYDFGDGWEHEIVAEKFLPFDPTVKVPYCVDGERACPPEDCGSFPGYEAILEALKARNPTEDQKDMLEWVGKDYDPGHFDLKEVNRRLAGRGRR